MSETAEGGTCSTCRQPLVRVTGRTYHPAVTYLHMCTAAKPIGASGYYSFDVPDDQFIPAVNPESETN